ncbi:MAG: NarK/NasA family nitrate transporter [Chloroflexi bacterium]|nr:NarK/NasA family nitrate transporter [Chloroflexota bacterium]
MSPLAPLFRESLQLSATEAGILVAVPVLLGSVARIPIGILTDRFGGRIVFSALMGVVAVPLVFIGLATSYTLLLFWAFWLGLAGASFAVGIPYVSRWFAPGQQGFALGIYGMGNIGTALAASVAPRVAASTGLTSAFWVFLFPLLGMAVLFFALGREAPGALFRVRSMAEELHFIRRRPLSWVLSLFYFVTFGGFVAISIYLPTYLVDAYGLEKTDAATRAAGFVVMATLARPLGGYLADRRGGDNVLTWAFVVVAILAVVLAFQPGMVVLTVAFLGIAAVVGIGNGAVFKLVAQYFPQEAGVVSGVVGAAGGLGGFFPPVVMGLVKDITGTYAVGFMLLSEFALACLIINLLVVQGRGSALTPPGA